MNSLVLMGAPGSGKSTVGRILAENAHIPFIDTDQLIEETIGESISSIFVNKGEPFFRGVERECVQQALHGASLRPAVISLGGGSILDVRTQQDLDNFPVAWLQVSIAQALKRVGMNQARPLLLGNVRSQMINLLQERTPIYERLADYIIDTSDASPDQCADELMAYMTSQGVNRDSSH